MSEHLYTPPSTTLLISEISGYPPLTGLFESVQHQPYAMLLDTAGSDKRFGRFNIMVWEPDIIVITRNNITTVSRPGYDDSFEVNGKPLAVLDTVQRHYFSALQTASDVPIEILEQLPFQTGTVGLAGYDLGRSYETVPSKARNDYRCPDLAAGLYSQSLIEDNDTGKLYYCRLDNKPSQPDFITREDKLTKAGSFSLTGAWQSNLTEPEYISALETINEYLLAGDCYQVNMAQRFTATYNGNEWDAYKTLRTANKAPFSAFIRLDDAAILSISPERFLSVKDGCVETKPIKGTRPRFADKDKDRASAEDLLSAEKDRAENLMIVDLLRNDLSKHCRPGSVKVPALFALESYEAVHHMVSTITGKLNTGASPLDLLAGAFPGGSITGAPKIRAMEIIDELEPDRRNVYCGSIFYVGHRQDMDSSILIRTLLAENGRLHCWAGGGIVADSVAGDEYQETLDKVSKILPVLETKREPQ